MIKILLDIKRASTLKYYEPPIKAYTGEFVCDAI